MKNEKIILIIFPVLFFLLQCKNKSEFTYKIPDSYIEQLQKDISGNEVKSLSMYERIDIYADSINNVKNIQELPAFIFDSNLDVKYGMEDLHKNISIRKMVIDSIDNPEILKMIINSGNPSLKKTIDTTKYHYRIPEMNKSTYQLVKERLMLLESKN